MQNLFYKWAVSTKVQFMDHDFLKAIEIIEKHNLYNSIKDAPNGKFSIEGEKPYFFKKSATNKTVYDMFIDNLHIHISYGDNEKIFSIRLKKKEEDWDFKKNDDECWDVSHPVNETFEVFVWYDVPVLDITRSIGYVYKHGSWDKYVYKTLNKFMKSIDEMTTAYKFGADYKRKIKKKK